MSARLSTVAPRACSGRHVGRRAEDDAHLRVCAAEALAKAGGAHHRGGGAQRIRARARRVAGQDLREAEVQHLHRAVGGQLDVRGLQVAVDDAALVGVLEGVGQLQRDRQRFVKRQREPRAIRSASVGPSTSSMTIARTSPSCAKPWICAMCG